MFPILKIFVIYLVIPSCTYTSPTNGDRTTKTLNSLELVEKELAPIKCSLKKISDSLTNHELKFDLGEVQGLVKKIIERAIKVDRLLMDKANLETEKDKIKQSALKVFVVPYLCRNLELYENVWDCGGQNSANFNADDLRNTDVERHDLDTQTFSNYKSHAKIWDRILQSSTHPLAIDFKTRIQLLYPKLSLQIIAKNIGLTYALLNNAKHGIINDEPELVALVNPDNLILTLKKWKALKDPVVLTIIKTFEQVISGINDEGGNKDD